MGNNINPEKKDDILCTNKEQEASQFEEVEPQHEKVKVKKVERTDSYFDGKVLDLIGWKILAFLITIITFTIGAPWAKCMIMSYKVNHTVLNGKRLKFNGNGGSLFVQRLKWFLLTIITLGIYSLWVPVKEKKWELSNICFEDEGQVIDESFFDGKMIQYLGISILCNFLNIISFGILYAFTICIRYNWYAKHSIINRKKIVFNGNGLDLLLHYLLWYFLTLITFGIFGFWLEVNMEKWKANNSHIKSQGEEEVKNKSIFVLVIIFVIGLIVLLTIMPSIVKNVIPNEDKKDELISDMKTAQEEAFDYYKTGAIKENEEYDIKVLKTFDKYNEGKIEGTVVIYADDTDKNSLSESDVVIKFSYDNYTCYTSYYEERCEYVSIFDKIGNYFKNLPKNDNKYQESPNTTLKPTIDDTNSNNTNNSNNNVNSDNSNSNSNGSSSNEQPASRCNSGYVYVEDDGLCYSKTDKEDGTTTHIYDDEGNIIASGVGCASSEYRMFFDEALGFDDSGTCYRVISPNY